MYDNMAHTSMNVYIWMMCVCIKFCIIDYHRANYSWFQNKHMHMKLKFHVISRKIKYIIVGIVFKTIHRNYSESCFCLGLENVGTIFSCQ